MFDSALSKHTGMTPLTHTHFPKDTINCQDTHTLTVPPHGPGTELLPLQPGPRLHEGSPPGGDGRQHNLFDLSLPVTLDPLQFSYRPNRSTDDVITITLHTTLSHLDKRNTYVNVFY
jgi:hypothetical protein